MDTSPGRGSGGFTLLEVMVALFVFAVVMGALLTMVQENLARLGRARMETVAARLSEAKMREIEAGSAEGSVAVESDEGTFDPPNDMLRWELEVEPFAIELSEEHQERASSSSVFQQTESGPGAEPPGLQRVVLRVFPEHEDVELIDPFVLILVQPPDSAGPDEP